MSMSYEYPLAVFMDLSAVFFAIRDLYPDRQMDYSSLPGVLYDGVNVARIRNEMNELPRHSDVQYVAWTSYTPSNQGQQKFLSYLETTWKLRRFSPSDSFTVDPSSMNLGPGDRPAQRLIRFDASIAFAIGALAKTHEIVVISDSFSLAEPLARAAMSRGESSRSHLAFFGSAIDGRWAKKLRGDDLPISFIDFEDYEAFLFGTRRTQNDDAFFDEFLIR